MQNIPQLVQDDPWLEPYAYEINGRIERFRSALSKIEQSHSNIEKFAHAYREMGLNYDKKKKGWFYREWAPAAESLFLIGDFNNWNRKSHPLTRLDNGMWEIFVPGKELVENSKVKVHTITSKGQVDRMPAWIRYAVQDENSHDFSGLVTPIEDGFNWTDQDFDLKSIKECPLIYEAHVGIAQEREGLGTYREFADNILPRIKKLGYNTVQLMAIQEHPYYGSFGYHVSSFFGTSSRFGTIEDFKYLVNKAHGLGIAVIIDLVHSHAVKNIAEGLNEFDGSDDQYFHPGGKGYHNAWDSKLFNYGKPEVQQFLLSNVQYWIKEFHVDGYRFDGITSMMYFHHGDFTEFDHYDKYFVNDVDWDSLVYLQLANALVHKIKPDAITIAEDMSGMPGLCRIPEHGGIGFDFRLGMGIPDFWIKYLKHKKDEEWDIHELWSVMVNRRYQEKTVAYAESHDQAIVGDKSVAFWLMDKEMYWHMQVDDANLVIDRGLALHKMIRLYTASLGGEAYLNFIGNEFGHPEWIDFPREGNNWSYKYARRQWSLVDNPKLKYKYLNDFDQGMIQLIKKNQVLPAIQAQQLNMDTVNQVIIFERANLIFLFNFSPTNSVADYRFYVPKKGKYKIILSSDDAEFGGFDRVDTKMLYPSDQDQKLSVYLPCRTALVLKKQR
ncbi:MAG: alpha amylase C-terminal domain-containing protein [Cyclobacteriaceae bacterium]|nr:alpha amylase C-terminal domain-containing protein [Cyclobacteriaceae bacterium]